MFNDTKYFIPFCFAGDHVHVDGPYCFTCGKYMPNWDDNNFKTKYEIHTERLRAERICDQQDKI